MEYYGNIVAQVLAALPARVMLLDNSGRVLAVTEKCLQQVLKRERSEVMGQNLPTALGFVAQGGRGEELAEVLAVQNALDFPQVWQGRLVDWQVRLQPLFGEDGSQVAALLVFENHCQEAARLEEYLRCRQLAANYRNMVHLFKNDILAINGLLQVLEKKCELAHIHIDTLLLLRQRLEESAAAYADYINVGNLHTEPGDYSLNEVVQEVLRIQQLHFAAAGIELQTDLDEELPLIFLDKQRIKQVLTCCLDNSRDAVVQKGRPGGRVTVSTQFDVAKGEVRLLVEDNGLGLTQEQQARFFQPYYTTKPDGNGIGTSVSRAIVRLHGGEMSVNGRQGEGCRVCIELPVQSSGRFNFDAYNTEIDNMVLGG